MLLEGLFSLFSNVLLYATRIDGGNNFPHPLSPEKEKEYLDKFHDENDMEARNILIKHNLRLVVYIAKKYVNYPDNDELISVGTLGLMKAVNSYNQSKGSSLATYAGRCIENEILMTMRSYKKRAQDISVYDCIGMDKEGNDLPVIEMLQTDEEGVYEQLENEFVHKTMQKIMTEELSEREKTVIEKRFGMADGITRTQQKVANEMGISRSYISRIEKRALKKLKKYLTESDLEI